MPVTVEAWRHHGAFQSIGVRAAAATGIAQVRPATVSGGGGGAPALKPRFGGLDVTNVSNISGYAANECRASLDKAHTWNDLEPTQGSYNFGPVHTMLDGIPSGAMVKLLADGGNYAPDWLKAITGTVRVYLSRGQSYGDCAMWWKQAYQDAYTSFQSAFAAEFEDDSRVRAVVFSGVMTENSEPFTLGGDGPSGTALYNAGLNATNHASSITATLEPMFEVWKTTRIELALHSGWQTAVSGGIQTLPWTSIRDFINPLVTTYGSHLITADYGLGPTDFPQSGSYTLANAPEEYAWMQLRGNDSGYQLTGATDVNLKCTAVMNAVRMGGAYCEHSDWDTGTDSVSGNTYTVAQQNAFLLQNAGLA